MYRTEGPAVGMVSNLMAFGTREVQRKIAKPDKRAVRDRVKRREDHLDLREH